MLTAFIARLTSRKFLLAVSVGFGLLANKQYTEAATVAATYILGEAAIDFRSIAHAVADAADVVAEELAEADAA